MTFVRSLLAGFVILCTTFAVEAARLREAAVLQFPQPMTARFPLQATDRAPDAHATVKVIAQEFKVDIVVELDDLKPATLFGGDYNTYVLWTISHEGEMQNLGEFILDGDRSTKRASIMMRTFGIIITAEPHYLVSRPSPFVVFELRSDRPTSIIRYPVIEGVYNFERSRLPNMKAARGRVQTDMKQAFTAFQLAQRAGANELAKDELIGAERSLDEVVTLLRHGVSQTEISALARETVRLAVAAQRLAEDRAFSALESTGKARQEETAWRSRPIIKRQ